MVKVIVSITLGYIKCAEIPRKQGILHKINIKGVKHHIIDVPHIHEFLYGMNIVVCFTDAERLV